MQAQAGVEVVSVANRTKASGQKVAKEFGIANVSDDWTEVVNDPDLDAICIGTWPYMHAPITIAALEAANTCSAKRAWRLIPMKGNRCSTAHAIIRNQIAQIVPAPHTLALDQTIRELIGEGYVGEIIQVDARINAGAGFPQWDAPVHWRHDRELSGNNVMNMGIWYEAMMRWMGPAATVNAVGQNIVRHRKDSKGNRVTMTIPDHVDVMGRLEQGGQYRMNVSSVVGHADPADVMIFGTEGTLRVAAGTVWRLGAGLVRRQTA